MKTFHYQDYLINFNMYKEEKIKEMISYLKERKKEKAQNLKPYLAIAQPRRNVEEMAAQRFVNEDGKLDTFSNFYSAAYIWTNGRLIDEARNMLCEQAINIGAKYIFFIGEDTVVPRHAFVDLHILAEANPDAVVSGVYYFKAGEPMIMANGEDGYRVIPDVSPGKIIENPILIGIDVMLIPVRILKELKEKEEGCPFFCIMAEEHPWYGPFVGEDEWFLNLLYKNNYRVLVTTDVQCLHMDLATGNYTAHPDVDLNTYKTQIPIGRRLNSSDRAYLDNRWGSRIPKPDLKIDKKLKKQNK